jgi:hypothetical protein
MTNDKIREWQRYGINLIPNFNALKQQVESGKLPRYYFLVLDNRQSQIDWVWLERYVNCLAYRIVIIDKIPKDVSENLKKTMVNINWNEVLEHLSTPDALSTFLWEKWVQSWWGNFTLCVRGIQKQYTNFCECFIQQGDDQTSSQNPLLFDHQGESDNTNLFKKAAFHECFTGGTSTDTLLQSRDSRMRWRVKEAAAISVGVLDERVFLEKDNEAREAVDKYSKSENKKIIKAWQTRRVYLFNHESAIGDFEQFVQNKLAYYGFLDFFIIHQGIIDAIKKSDEEKHTSKFTKGWNILKEKVRWLIIDTGRGRPDQAIRECLRWVEYSNLAEFVLQRCAVKYDLAQLLFALQAEFTRMEEK